jgi:peptidoglycan hydrolase-like protein with peptidoglycan-binding domain
MSTRPVEFDEEEEVALDERPDWRERVQTWLLQHPKDAVALLAAAVAVGCIAVNALFLQIGPHPAPLFALRQPVPAPARAVATDGLMPRPRPAPTDVSEAGARQSRARSDLVGQIQHELAVRGYYDGVVDGVVGPKTDAAMREFAHGARIAFPAEPNAALLQAITRAGVREARPTSASIPRGRDPIADLIGPTSRILAVQRALSDYGYGQIKPTGIVGPDTVAAIERFERTRQMPVTGQMSERLVRELAAVTGRPLE